MPDTTPIVLQQIDLDIIPGKIPPIVHVSEYDTGRNIIINLFKDGYPFGSNSIESYTVKVEGSIGKYGFSENAAWADDAEGAVVVNLTEAMTAIHGRVWTKIKLIKSESMQISTCGFWMDVDRAGVEADTVIGAPGFEEQIQNAVEDWLDEHGGGSGLTDAAKSALLACFQNVAWITSQGQTYYQALYDALYPAAPPATLLSISAAFNQGGHTVYDTDSLDSLKPYLTVTAHYSNGTSQTVTAYTLSGTLAEGTSTITASYGGRTTTFTVEVTSSSIVTLTFRKGVAVSKLMVTAGDILQYGIYAKAAAARASTAAPFANDNYVFTVTDSSKYSVAAYDVASLEQHATIYGDASLDGYYYQGGSKSISWKESDSVTTPYVWLVLKKNDGTEFTDAELANSAAAVVTVSHGS